MLQSMYLGTILHGFLRTLATMTFESLQITPMLGMLRHMASYARAKKADPHAAVGIPDKVYLIWSSRSEAELQLLDQDLIDLAR